MAKSNVTTIHLDKSVVEALKKARMYPGETYNEIILNLLIDKEETRNLGIFVQKTQETRMKEL